MSNHSQGQHRFLHLFHQAASRQSAHSVAIKCPEPQSQKWSPFKASCKWCDKINWKDNCRNCLILLCVSCCDHFLCQMWSLSLIPRIHEQLTASTINYAIYSLENKKINFTISSELVSQHQHKIIITEMSIYSFNKEWLTLFELREKNKLKRWLPT